MSVVFAVVWKPGKFKVSRVDVILNVMKGRGLYVQLLVKGL